MTDLKHFLDALGIDGTILADVGTEDQVGALWLVALLVGCVIAQLLEDRLRHVGVEVVDEDVLGHIVLLLGPRGGNALPSNQLKSNY